MLKGLDWTHFVVEKKRKTRKPEMKLQMKSKIKKNKIKIKKTLKVILFLAI